MRDDLGADDFRGPEATATEQETETTAIAPGHWAFQPLQRVVPPASTDSWVRTPIDAFVLKALQERALTPSAGATRSTLIRRSTFGLLGLPPTPEQVELFLNDSSTFAYEALVDRLLSSPHYGERWGRHWLDVARFGESEGSNPEEDRPRGDAYKYRDAVIRAWNQDLPFDEFVSYQVAGRTEGADALARELARFVKLGTRLQRNSHPNDKKLHILDDMVSATGSAFLALTVGCARCHDHKLDPITSEEYYRLTAVFFDLADVSSRVGANDVELLREPHLLAAGSWQHPMKRVEPGFVDILTGGARSSARWFSPTRIKKPPKEQEGARDTKRTPREALAAWLTDVEFGAGALLARVIVNRVWQYHFGRGIVSTPNDFGQLGESPTHPELLDWLATTLIRGGWRLKQLHRLILTSSTYRQASGTRWASIDRDNKWLWHFRTRRLEAEAIRDTILHVSGALRTNLFGPSVSVGSARRDYVEKPEHWRRSVYLMAPRFATHPVLEVFDAASTFRSQAGRIASTTPRSALFLLNAEFSRKQAERLAKRVAGEVGVDVSAQVDRVYLICFSRPPTTEERELGVSFLTQPEAGKRSSSRGSLVNYCQSILSTNELIYIP